MRLLIKVKPVEDRLDKFLQTKLKLTSRNQIRKLIDDGHIKVNQQAKDPDYRLRRDDKIDVLIPIPEINELKGENIPLKVLYEDQDLIVIDKVSDMVVHPTIGHPSGTLVNALLFHWKNLPDVGKSLRPGIVHRLDKDTSGLMLVAKNELSFDDLKNQFKKHTVKKSYLALVSGTLTPGEGVIKAGIIRHPKNPMKFTVSSEGRAAETRYKVLKEGNNLSYLQLWPKTGRTHQLRVHLSAIGHPIIGDSLYGGKKLLNRQFLHATSLEVTSPSTRKKLSWELPLPADLQAVLDKLLS